ncbi:hypothetical protein [Leisingera thetidis]|uniref:hypothetical protein n=1 Tax=Leisingera thetidis TaxID=2930199 RepID=UPI0021F7A85B|nr:hypothetical protein [Leisingera thetidis]
MTLQPKFTQAQPVILDEAPVVLRFAGLFPQGLAKERQKLKSDADYVRDLRQKWEPEDAARLSRITLGGIDSGPK